MSRSSNVPKQQKRSGRRLKQPQRRRSPALWWGLGAIASIAVLAVVFAVATSSSRNAASARTTRDVALACTTDMATQFHIHPHLDIIINGQPQLIPANIGITPACLSALHTHDTSGTIHVESPEQRDFTLGDFFAVWHQPFNQNQILEYKTDQTHVIQETVNGRTVQSFEQTILHDGDQIVIAYGAPT